MTLNNIPKLVPLEEALEYYLERLQQQKSEIVSIDKIVGRVLSKDIYANQHIPHFNRSPLDGYAIMGEDTANADSKNPVWLEILEEIPAGYNPTKKLTSGFATKISTGAPLPEGTTAVIRYEDTILDAKRVGIFKQLKPGTPVVGAIKDGKPIIGLSGNPGAASITFDLLVRPILRHMFGHTNIYRPKVRGHITG